MNFETARQSLIEDKSASVPCDDYASVFAEASPKLLQALFVARMDRRHYPILDALEDIFREYVTPLVTDDIVQEMVDRYADESAGELRRRTA